MVQADESRGTSWLGSLQERPELFRTPTTPNEKRVGIVTLWQQDAKGHDAVCAKAVGQSLCSLLSALVGVDIEGEIDGALAITQLVELGVIQMGAQRAGRVLKTGLP
jgi:hypothetical protein